LARTEKVNQSWDKKIQTTQWT